MLKLAFFNLFRRKSRTALALAGLIIGIGSLIVMIGLVEGIFLETTEALGNLQGLYVLENGKVDDTLSFLDESYVDELAKLSGVKHSIPNTSAILRTVDGETQGLSASAIFGYGTAPETLEESFVGEVVEKLTKGRSLRSGDRRKLLMSQTLADRLKKNVGDSIELNDSKFKIVGIGEVTSELYANILVLTNEDAKELSDFPRGKISTIYLVLKNPEDASKIAQIIDFKYEDELDVYTQQDFADQIGGFLGIFRQVTMVVALIAAFVAAVVVMNTMLMSILERFKEIGVLKAIGWTNDDVVKMIMLEAFFLGFLGGFGSLIVAFMVQAALWSSFGLNVLITPELVLQALVFSIVLSLIAAVYPAQRAVKLNPIDAIREE
ncbi:MAG: ABC transporter permease [Candidatus Diapherotrites archaeon]|nr:ABC transporter permease [Candidatus Diapherotrites archaeon]